MPPDIAADGAEKTNWPVFRSLASFRLSDLPSDLTDIPSDLLSPTS